LAERQRSLLTERVDSLREAFREVKNAHPFVIDAVVVLPDHLHTIWGDADFGLRWRQIESAFSRTIEKHAGRSRLTFKIISKSICYLVIRNLSR
jgi:putative transposase